MAFGGFEQGPSQPMSEINVTPLVDVMLVLLVIFIVTAPLFTHAVKVDLPQTAAKPAPQKPDTIAVAIDGEGRVFWNTQQVALAELRARLAQAATKHPQPEIHLHADKATRYQTIADVLAAAQNAGLQKMGFITNPGKGR